MIGLGVGIDYALFILTRFRNGLDEGLEPRQAAIAAVDTAGRAVLFAGITVIISLMGMLLLGITFLYGVAMAAALAVLFTMIAALTLLPALLTIAGRRVDRLRIPGLGNRADQHRRRQPLVPLEPRDPAPAGARGAALRRPAARPLHPHPLAAARLQRRRHRTRRARRRARPTTCSPKASAPASTGPSRWSPRCRARATTQGLVQLCKTLEDEEGVAAVTAVVLNPAEEHRRLPGLPDDLAAERGDDRTARPHPRRRDPADRAETGAQLHVGGITAIFEDFGNAITEKLPLFIGVVVLLSALLLMAVFRSVLVPLKAMVMNLLSIGAAFGIIVAVFQWGWGASLIGVDGTGPIISFFPIFLFAIVFGLSMDYEVFLMSRIHEEWEHRHDADRRRDPRPGPDRPRDHRGGGDHGHRLRLLHARRRPDHQALRPRPRLGGLHRRGDHPLGPGPGDHAALRQARLVASRLARPDPPPPPRRAAEPSAAGRAGEPATSRLLAETGQQIAAWQVRSLRA